LLGAAALAVAFWIAAPVVVPAITPGFDAATTQLAVDLTRVMVVGPVFLALGAVATSILNASGRFGAAAVAPIAYNLGIIAGAVAAAVLGLGVEALAVGVVIGSIGHLVVQVPAIRRWTGFIYEPRIRLDDPDARKVFALLAPRALGLGAAQITFIVNTTLASTLAAGSITAYAVAFTIVQLPIGFFAIPLGIVLLPTMSRSAALGAHAELASMVDRALRPLAYAMMIVTATAIVTRVQIVTLLFDYGRFDQEAIDLTASVLALFLLGLTAHGAIAVLARAFYADQDTRTPVAAAIVSVGVNVAVSVLTVGTLGLLGLALGIALGAWVEVSILLWRLGRRLGDFDPLAQVRAWAGFAVLAVVAGALATAALVLTETWLAGSSGKLATLVELAVAGAVGLAAYAGLSRVLGVGELGRVLGLTRRAIRGERVG
jgi:putative peptidoglycan lipid II flippase